MINLLQGDCLELMKDIPDKSIDMILCDLPYGTTRCKWDSIIPFEPLWEQYSRIIKDNGANEGETVLDNCMGSGSTGVACVNTNRNFIGIELDEKYFDISERRIKDAEIGKLHGAD